MKLNNKTTTSLMVAVCSLLPTCVFGEISDADLVYNQFLEEHPPIYSVWTRQYESTGVGIYDPTRDGSNRIGFLSIYVQNPERSLPVKRWVDSPGGWGSWAPGLYDFNQEYAFQGFKGPDTSIGVELSIHGSKRVLDPIPVEAGSYDVEFEVTHKTAVVTYGITIFIQALNFPLKVSSSGLLKNTYEATAVYVVRLGDLKVIDVNFKSPPSEK